MGGIGKSKKRIKHPKYPVGTPCAYCGRVTDELEKEHVFPDSWYPARTTRDNMLIVPACCRCNRFFGQHEHDARILALASDHRNELTKAATESLLNSFDVARARDAQDRAARLRRGAWLQSKLKLVHPSEAGTAIWSSDQVMQSMAFTTEGGIQFEAIPAMDMPVELQAVVVHKWMRGCYYHVTKSALPLFIPWNWQCPTADENPGRTISQMSDLLLPVFRVPAFQAWGRLLSEDRSIWMFVIWNEFVYWSVAGNWVAPASAVTAAEVLESA